jgi:hypothetical protein
MLNEDAKDKHRRTENITRSLIMVRFDCSWKLNVVHD